jgi:chemotaxis protein CheZ
METPGVEEKEAQMRARQLESARQLVAHMESGDDESAGRLIEELGRMHESLIFQELGKLTRDLHEALNAFRMDSRLSEITETEIPDAKERLNYVVTLTEQSAHRTLNAVEESLPMAETLAGRAGELAGAWERFRARELSAEEFRRLSGGTG